MIAKLISCVLLTGSYLGTSLLLSMAGGQSELCFEADGWIAWPIVRQIGDTVLKLLEASELV